MNKQARVVFVVLGLLPVVGLLAWGYISPSAFFNNQEWLRDFISGYGTWAPIILIALQILQVVLAPISHYMVGIVGGFLFGTWYGFILNYIGRIIGHTFAFFLSRKVGRPIIKKLIKPGALATYDRFWNTGGSFALFLAYYLPLFPDDEISYVAGASKMKTGSFMTANILGQIGGSLALAYIGAGVELQTMTFAIVFLITGALSLLFTWMWWRQNKRSPSGQVPRHNSDT